MIHISNVMNEETWQARIKAREARKQQG